MNSQVMKNLVKQVSKESDGHNPGAMRLGMDMLRANAEDAVQFAINDGILGSELWILYKYIHSENLQDCINSLRNEQSLNELASCKLSKFYKG